MKIMFKLYIDESGKNTLTDVQSYAPHFCVAGIQVHVNHDGFLTRRADQIKYKYWGNTKVTFRANDIRRLTGDFTIFENKPDLFTNFCEDFKEYIRCSNFHLIWIGINKFNYINDNPPVANAIRGGWKKQITAHEKGLTQKIFEELWKVHICYLISKSSYGNIIVEAADKVQDIDILTTYNHILSSGVSSMGLSGVDVREKFTSISFVTKKNLDAETQIADIGSHFLSLDARLNENVPYNGITQFDREMITLLKRKLFIARCNGARQNSCQII